MMYRRGVGVAETKKRQPPIPIPARYSHTCADGNATAPATSSR